MFTYSKRVGCKRERETERRREIGRENEREGRWRVDCGLAVRERERQLQPLCKQIKAQSVDIVKS